MNAKQLRTVVNALQQGYRPVTLTAEAIEWINAWLKYYDIAQQVTPATEVYHNHIQDGERVIGQRFILATAGGLFLLDEDEGMDQPEISIEEDFKFNPPLKNEMELNIYCDHRYPRSASRAGSAGGDPF